MNYIEKARLFALYNKCTNFILVVVLFTIGICQCVFIFSWTKINAIGINCVAWNDAEGTSLKNDVKGTSLKTRAR